MHSEQGTIPASFINKGLKNCTYKIGFPEAVLEKLQFLHVGYNIGTKQQLDSPFIK